MWRVSSVLFGIGSLLDAGLRVWMAYTLAPDEVPALSTGLYAATSIVLIVGNGVYYIVSGVYNPTSSLYRTAALPGAQRPYGVCTELSRRRRRRDPVSQEGR